MLAIKATGLLTIAMVPVVAAPAVAQPSLTSAFTAAGPDSPMSVSQRSFSFRTNDLISADGSRRKRTSIIAGLDVAPNTVVGVGLFESMPKARGRGPDPKLDGMSKRSRKAAIGMSFRF